MGPRGLVISTGTKRETTVVAFSTDLACVPDLLRLHGPHSVVSVGD